MAPGTEICQNFSWIDKPVIGEAYAVQLTIFPFRAKLLVNESEELIFSNTNIDSD